MEKKPDEICLKILENALAKKYVTTQKRHTMISESLTFFHEEDLAEPSCFVSHVFSIEQFSVALFILRLRV